MVLAATLSLHAGEIEVCFSPNGGAQAAVIREIDASREEIRIQAFIFTDTAIANALRKALQRGVKVEVVLDGSQKTTNAPAAMFLYKAGIPVLIDAVHAIAHNKIMLIDGNTILTGSYNFTLAAEHSNAENLLVLKGFPAVVQEYLRNYATHRAHSAAYRPPAEERAPQARPGDQDIDPVVFVTKEGKRYHRWDCPAFQKSKIPIRLSEAKRLGFTPCLRCGPRQ